MTLSGKVSTDVVVEYTIANSSTEGTEDADFPDPLPSRTGNVPIKVGETTGSIPVATFDDMLAEDTETFTVTLRLVPNSRVALGTAVATGTIRDNERLTVIVEGPDKVAQGQDANYKVRLRGGTGSEEVKVNYTQNGVAAQTPITIAAERDEPANDLEITTGSDQLVEGRTLVIRLTSVNTDAGTVALGSPSSKRTEIVDPNTVTINVADAADVEDEDAQDAAAEFNVTRAGTGNIQGIVTVTYRVVEGSASTADYKAPSGELELASNETGTITVLVVNDEIAEGDETFSVLLTGATSDYDPPPEGTPDLLELGRRRRWRRSRRTTT